MLGLISRFHWPHCAICELEANSAGEAIKRMIKEFKVGGPPAATPAVSAPRVACHVGISATTRCEALLPMQACAQS